MNYGNIYVISLGSGTLYITIPLISVRTTIVSFSFRGIKMVGAYSKVKRLQVKDNKTRLIRLTKAVS
jgi:hypothetical protein